MSDVPDKTLGVNGLDVLDGHRILLRLLCLVPRRLVFVFVRILHHNDDRGPEFERGIELRAMIVCNSPSHPGLLPNIRALGQLEDAPLHTFVAHWRLYLNVILVDGTLGDGDGKEIGAHLDRDSDRPEVRTHG